MTPAPNRVKLLLQQSGSPDKFPKLREQLDNLKFEGLTPAELEDWYYARAAVEFRTAHRKEAFRYAKEGVDKFPASGRLNYSLGQEYEALGKPDLMLACFRKVKPGPDLGAAYLTAMARYFYLWGMFKEGLEMIDPIFQTYHSLKIIDDHFLYIRGLPFYSEAFGFLAALAVLSGEPKLAAVELEKGSKDLADYHFGREQLTLNATLSGDWSPVLDELETYLASPEAVAAPAGYPSALRAVLLSRKAESLPKAVEILEGVKLAAEDFPWLADALTLAKAEAAGRFEDRAREQALVQVFLARQPFLFEPHHAFHFGFLPYQEKLREAYRKKVSDSA